MTDPHSSINEEDRGIRAFQSRRAKAVESALSRMRHGLGEAWAELSSAQIEEVGWVLGELWAYVAHARWEELHFGLLTPDDVNTVLELGALMRSHARAGVEVLDQIDALISSKG